MPAMASLMSFFSSTGSTYSALDHVEHGGQLLQLFQRQRRQRAARHGLQLHRGQRAGHGAHGQQPATFSLEPMSMRLSGEPAPDAPVSSIGLDAGRRLLGTRFRVKPAAARACTARRGRALQPLAAGLGAARSAGRRTLARAGRSHVVDLGADADPLAHLVVVVRGHVRHHRSPLARRSV
jgi:hypothetical protein